jgi:hypothetical protein
MRVRTVTEDTFMSAAPTMPPALLASGAYAALLASLEDGILAPADAELFRAAADARIFGEDDVEQRMEQVYAALYRLTAEDDADLAGLRGLRNRLFSIPRGAAARA